MQNHIIEYLLQNRSFPILGLGNLTYQNIPATYSAVEQAYFPPAQKVVFEANSKTDTSSFISFLVERCKMDISLAQQSCKLLANSLNQLAFEDKFSIAHAGYFTKNKEGELCFHSYVLPSVFYPRVDAKKIIRPSETHTLVVGDSEVTNEFMNELLTSASSEKKYNWWMSAVCLMMIAISLLLVYYFRGGNLERFGNNQPIEIKNESPTHHFIK
jgi:hypothetical protein